MKPKIKQISSSIAATLCKIITADLPEYFGLPECNEQYARGVKSRTNFAIKVNETYVGLLSLEFPYPNNCNVYWIGILSRYHRKGLGRALLNEACNFAANRNSKTMTVETLALSEADENS